MQAFVIWKDVVLYPINYEQDLVPHLSSHAVIAMDNSIDSIDSIDSTDSNITASRTLRQRGKSGVNLITHTFDDVGALQTN